MPVYTYKAFYNRQSIEVDSDTSYHAQKKAAVIFKAKAIQDVTVMLLSVDGIPVQHATATL
jgi:hypothetical protein